MRILITTGLGSADIGGPFQYAPRLKSEFMALGHEVEVLSYGRVEKALPMGLRHIYFFLRILPKCLWADYVLILDTFSSGVPSAWAASLCRKRAIARVGGDFLWSAYVNRTGAPLSLPAFYERLPKLNLKEKLILSMTRGFLKRAGYLAFNTEWQRNIWRSFYQIKEGRISVVRNFIPEKREGPLPQTKNFIWAGRLIPEKNPEMLKICGIDIVTGESHEKVLEKIKNSYVAVSLAYTDISPNFIIEAISFNKPFIMTRETGLSELFPKGGIFVNPFDSQEVERAMEAMLDDNTYNRYVGELKGITLKHSWRQIAEEYLNIWYRM